MFKKIIGLLLGLVLIGGLYLAYTLFLNPKSPKGESSLKNDSLDIKVTYSRPYKKDRLLFGSNDTGALVPYGQYWRLGANFATVFETKTSISFHGRPLPAGGYRMYAIPYADHWTVVLNSEAGTFGYTPPEDANDIMRVNVPVMNKEKSLEQFTIDFVEDSTGASLRMRWDTTMVLIGLK